MGLIGRQAIKGSLISYLGIVLGFITTIFLSTIILNTEQNGLIILLTSYLSLFGQLASLGLGNALVRFLPKFKADRGEYLGFLYFILFGSFLGCCIFLLLGSLFNNFLFSTDFKTNIFFSKYIRFLIPLGFTFVFMGVMDSVLKATLFNAIFGSFLRDLLVRFGVFIGLILLYFKIIDFRQYMYLWLIIMSLPSIILTLYAMAKNVFDGKPTFHFLNPKKINEILLYCFLTILSGSSMILIQRIDIFMINLMVGLGGTGIYGITSYFATVIRTPSLALYNISSAVIAEKFNKEDYPSIFSIYKKSCVNQLFIGLLIFIGIWGNIHSLLKILPEVYHSGKYVIFFMGLGTLIDMGTGINGIILTQSKFYRYDSYSMILLIAITILLNLVFIPNFGIVGGAISSALSVGLFNFSRFILVWIKFGMQPLNYKNLLLIGVALFTYFVVLQLPLQSNIYLDLVLRSSLISMIYLLLTFIFNLSSDFNDLVARIKSKLFGLN